MRRLYIRYRLRWYNFLLLWCLKFNFLLLLGCSKCMIMGCFIGWLHFRWVGIKVLHCLISLDFVGLSASVVGDDVLDSGLELAEGWRFTLKFAGDCTYKTRIIIALPINRIVEEGTLLIFTDHYDLPACQAGIASHLRFWLLRSLLLVLVVIYDFFEDVVASDWYYGLLHILS